MKCAKTRAYCLPIAERPSGSCAVLTGSLAKKESCCVIATKCHCTEEKRGNVTYIFISVSSFRKREGSKMFERKMGPNQTKQRET